MAPRIALEHFAALGQVVHAKHLLIFIVNVTFFMSASSQTVGERRVLRCAAAHIPPFDLVTVYPNGSFKNAGGSRMVAEWLAEKLNVSLLFVYPPQDEVKERGNEATMDMVATDKADFTSNGFAVTPDRHSRVDFATYHNWEEGYRMVVPRPGDQDRLFAFIKPFDTKVWLLLGVSFVVVSLFMGLVTWSSDRQASSTSESDGQVRGARFSDYLGKYFLYNVNVLTTHGDYLSESKVPFIVGVGSWLLAASVLVYGYSSIVVSSITLPNQMPTVNSFEDVVSHPDISLIIRTDTFIGSLINTTTDVPIYNALRDKAKRRPESIGYEGFINSTALLLTGKYAFPFIDTPVRFMIANQYAKEGKCRYKLSKRLSVSNSYFFNTLQKGNKKLNRELSTGVMQLTESGLPRHWVKTLPWIPKAEKCFAETSKTTARQTSIKLIDLASAFFILGVGLALSALAFIAELTFFCRMKRTSHS